MHVFLCIYIFICMYANTFIEINAIYIYYQSNDGISYTNLDLQDEGVYPSRQARLGCVTNTHLPYLGNLS